MSTIYSTLPNEKQRIYQDLQTKLEAFQTAFVYQNVSYDSLCEIYKAVLEDHPEYFWLSGASACTTRTRGTFSFVEFRPEFRGLMSVDQAKGENVRFRATVSELISMVKRYSSDPYAQVLFLHDYLVLHSDYRDGSTHCFDAYGCLIEGKAVCAGYAAAFHVLMNKLGVECGRVRGSSASALTGEVSHEWNYIRLADGYYFVDVTWDDPVVSTGEKREGISHEFFCLDLDEIRLTHRFSSRQFVPSSCGNRYGYFKYFGMYAEKYSFDAVNAIARKQLERGDQFTVKFGSQAQLNAALHDLMDQQRVYSIPGVPNRISYHTSKSGLLLTVFVK